MAQKYKVNVSEDLGLTGRQLFEKDASLFDGDRDDSMIYFIFFYFFCDFCRFLYFYEFSLC